MSWNVGLSLGESFAEFSAINGRGRIQRRWFLPKSPLVDNLIQIFKENPELRGSTVNLTTKLAQVIMRHRAGAHVALLVTSGFEEWPRIRQPLKTRGFTLTPKRFRPLVSDDLIFGVTERTDADGSIHTPLKTEELEFLIPKLQLTETKQVAIGFLHSNANPSHEKSAAEILRNNGFEVLCSHEIEEHGNEVARWWRAMLNAYVAPAFHEFESQLEPLKTEFDLKFSFWSSNGEKFDGDPSRYYSSTLGHVAALSKLNKSKKIKNILHLGLEQFLILSTEDKSKIWQSDFGPVSLPSPVFKKTKIQPTQFIAADSIHGALFESLEAGYEPGPMIFGRTHKPTLLDVLFLQNHLDEIDGLTPHIAPGVGEKIEQSLHAIFKETIDKPTHAKKFIEDLALSVLAQDIKQNTLGSNVLCTGSMAPLLVPLIQERLPSFSLQIDKSSNFAESLAAAQKEGASE